MPERKVMRSLVYRAPKPDLSIRESPAPLHDGVAIRRYNDLFVRKVLDDKVVYDWVGEDRSAHGYPKDLRHDEQVRLTLHSRPDLEPLIKNSVIIEVLKDGNDIPEVASGVIMSESIIFTCAHIFKGGLIDRIRVLVGAVDDATGLTEYQANLVPLPNDLKESFRAHEGVMDFTEPLLKWTSRYPDFAVLRTEAPMVLTIQPMKLAVPTPFTEGTAVAMVGFAGQPSVAESSSCFTPDYLEWLDEFGLGGLEKTLKLTEIIDKGFSNFTTKVTCFGAIRRAPTFCYGNTYNDVGYCLSNMSSMNGLSGAPVVSLYRPNCLLGINLGSFTHIPGSCMIIAQIPPVVKLYERFVGRPI